MSYPVELADLMVRSLQRANLEGANQGTAPFISDSELTTAINVSIAKWWDLLIGSTFAGQIARAQYSFLTVANQSLYSLPGDFARLISLDAYTQSVPNTALTCQPYNEEQRNAWSLLPSVGWGAPWVPVAYMIQYPNLCLKPVPGGGTSMTVNYFPVAPRLNDRNDTLDSMNGWEEYIVLDVARKLAIKDGQLDIIQALESFRAEEQARILAAAPSLDQGAPERMHQTRGLEWEEGVWPGYGSGMY